MRGGHLSIAGVLSLGQHVPPHAPSTLSHGLFIRACLNLILPIAMIDTRQIMYVARIKVATPGLGFYPILVADCLFSFLLYLFFLYEFEYGPHLEKSVFGVSDKASFKPVSSATETSLNIQISLEASLRNILFKKRITKALIRLRRCAGWSAPELFANPQRQVFS